MTGLTCGVECVAHDLSCGIIKDATRDKPNNRRLRAPQNTVVVSYLFAILFRSGTEDETVLWQITRKNSSPN
jgi:hypothetical protein